MKDHAFHELCKFLDETDECQYSVSELLDYMETFLNGEDGYSIKYFKQKLKERYGDDIIITRNAGIFVPKTIRSLDRSFPGPFVPETEYYAENSFP